MYTNVILLNVYISTEVFISKWCLKNNKSDKKNSAKTKNYKISNTQIEIESIYFEL